VDELLPENKAKKTFTLKSGQAYPHLLVFPAKAGYPESFYLIGMETRGYRPVTKPVLPISLLPQNGAIGATI
jgi:hypothetical protein